MRQWPPVLRFSQLVHLLACLPPDLGIPSTVGVLTQICFCLSWPPLSVPLLRLRICWYSFARQPLSLSKWRPRQTSSSPCPLSLPKMHMGSSHQSRVKTQFLIGYRDLHVLKGPSHVTVAVAASSIFIHMSLFLITTPLC